MLRSTGCRSPLLPLDHARSAPQTARSSRAAISREPQKRGLPSAAGSGVALRLRFAIRSSSPSAPLSPLANRRPKRVVITEAGATTDAFPLGVPIIPLCGRSPLPGRILWAKQCDILGRAFCCADLPSRSAPAHRPYDKVTTILRATAPWLPTGVAVADGVVYVQEYDFPDAGPRQYEQRPRVRKMGRDGQITTLAIVGEK